MAVDAAASRHWADWRSPDFARLDRARAIAVLPVAAIEQHGPHLPQTVDADLAHGIVEAALPHLPPELPALFLPPLSIGYSPEHLGFAGTLSLKADTVLRLWGDVAESVAASGLRRLLLLNIHGGNVGLLDVAARDWRQRLGLTVVSSSWFNWPLIGPDGEDVSARFSAAEHRFGVHAGQIETAMMLALRPERVDMAAARDFASSSQRRAALCPLLGDGRSAKLAWMAQELNPAGATGHAAAARAEDGRAVLDAAGRALARLLVDFDRWGAAMADAPDTAAG